MSPPWSFKYLEAVVTKLEKTNSKNNVKVTGIILNASAFPEKSGSHSHRMISSEMILTCKQSNIIIN